MDIRTYVLGDSQDAASKFYLVKYNATNTWELHVAEDGDRQVVLHSRNQSSELLYMSDVLRPGSTDVLEGELAEWGVFILDNNVLDVRDGSALTERSFVAVHPEAEGGVYEIALYDGKCFPSSGRALMMTRFRTRHCFLEDADRYRTELCEASKDLKLYTVNSSKVTWSKAASGSGCWCCLSVRLSIATSQKSNSNLGIPPTPLPLSTIHQPRPCARRLHTAPIPVSTILTMPGAKTTLLIEGTFEELTDEFAQYIDSLKKSQGDESANLQGESADLLKENKKDDVLKKLVVGSQALNQAPEKGTAPAMTRGVLLMEKTPG